MASDRGVPGAGVFGDLPPSYTRSQPPANPDLLRRPSYCHAAFALKQISKVIHWSQSRVDFSVNTAFIQSADVNERFPLKKRQLIYLGVRLSNRDLRVACGNAV